MEEDNEEISGWNDDEFNILDNKSFKISKKKQTQIITNEFKISRKLKPSYTLPVIKNLRKSLIKQNNDDKDNKQDCNTDNLFQKIQKQIAKVQRINQIEDHIKQNTKNILKDEDTKVTEKNVQNFTRTQENSLQHKKIFRQKHSTTVIRQNEMSNIGKLKIKANEYCSTPKNLSLQEKERSKQLLRKLKQNFSKDFSKNSKSKYFIVKKQKISPLKVSQEISKIAIQSKRSYQEVEPSNQQRKNEILKERYKNIVKNIEIQRKNSCLKMNPKSQQLSRFSNQKKKNQISLNNLNHQSGNITSDHINERDQNLLNSKRYMKNVSALQSDEYPKIKKAKKLNKILQQSQQFSKCLRKNKQKSLNTLRLSDQIEQYQFIGQISMKKAENLSFILANRQKNVTLENSIKREQIKGQLKKNNYKQKSENRKNHTKLLTQPSVLDQFNDEQIFVNK